MNTNKNFVMKEDFAFWVSNEEGDIIVEEQGFYCYDTRYLSRYAWDLGEGFVFFQNHLEQPDTGILRYGRMKESRQTAAVTRNIRLNHSGFSEVLELTAYEKGTFSLALDWDNDFRDIFEVRDFSTRIERNIRSKEIPNGGGLSYRGNRDDCYETDICYSGKPVLTEEGRPRYVFSLDRGESLEIRIDVSCSHPDMTAGGGIPYDTWRKSFPPHLTRETGRTEQVVLRRAVDDLRSLLLYLPTGPYPSAGIPWFVAAFGRDALITALMLLPHQEEVALGVLRFLASRQGTCVDRRRKEEPGKILHEIRFGEATRRGLTPHSPYYGTVDATPLFIILLGRLVDCRGEDDPIRELRPHWEAALDWMEKFGDVDGDGFLEYRADPAEGGLVVQSWKDSDDSMHHEDGSIANGAIAPVEVQGYAYEAFCYAAKFYDLLGEEGAANRYNGRASDLKEKFHRSFWLEDLKTYAMALDGAKRPLRVKSSNPGHLLWNGIVPDKIAPLLVDTLLSEELWSGWGIRTLGKKEVLYNPVSYHNGSVWPHDSAIFAAGLNRYGFKTEARLIRSALFDLAFSQHDYRLPELISGYKRIQDFTILYPVACRPQAWDAAALLMMAEQK